MTVGAFARALPDFARGGEPAPPVEMESLAPQVPVEDPAKLLDEAYERGRRDGAADAGEAFERTRAADLAGFEERLTEARRGWAETESDRLAAEIRQAMQALETGIAASVARILLPFVAESVRRRALDELSETLTALLTGGVRTLVVNGPIDLVEPLKAKLGPYAQAVEFRPADGPDIVARSRDTVVETQIGAWLDRLAAAVE